MKSSSKIALAITAGIAAICAFRKKGISGIGGGIGLRDWGAYAIYVNKPKDGEYPYVVKLWSGSRYILDLYVAYASDEYEALERVVAYLDKKGDSTFFIDDATEEDEDNGYAIWVDATMEGARQPHYVREENLAVRKVAKEDLPYDYAKRDKYRLHLMPRW